MSTCPDLDLYSAYADGEVPSPWKEKLEAHLSTCPNCRARSEQYRKLKTLITANVRDLSNAELDASFARVSQRRMAVLAGKEQPHERVIPEWIHISIRMPLPALAAVILAAIFLPTVVILANVSRLQSQAMQYATQMPALPAQAGLNTSLAAHSRPVYSQDLPEQSMPVALTDSNKQVFTMIQYARQFTTDQDIFDKDGEIIIIRLPLPGLTRFGNSGTQPFAADSMLQQNASFYK